MNQDTYVPRGSTALLDAVGKTIDAVGERLAATPESERPSQVIVSILTGGYENASQTYSKPKVAEMIKHQTEKYNWAFEFQAANMDAFAAAKELSIAPDRVVQFEATGEGVKEAFALQAGREVRLIVSPDQVDDLQAIKIAKDVARKAEENLQYPGQIKVTVIRETRAVHYAK